MVGCVAPPEWDADVLLHVSEARDPPLTSSIAVDSSRPKPLLIGGVGGGVQLSPRLSIYLSPSAWHSPSRSRLLRSSVTSVMDEFECNLRPACVAQDPLWSLSGVRTTDRIFFPTAIHFLAIVFFTFEKKKQLMKGSAIWAG